MGKRRSEVRGTRHAFLQGMLFESDAEDSARRVVEALVAAETGDLHAWRKLDEGALYRLRTDADALISLVPVAFINLAEQLTRHPRSGVRVDTVRYAALAWPWAQQIAEQMLAALSNDRSRGVQRAARLALGYEDEFEPPPLEPVAVMQ